MLALDAVDVDIARGRFTAIMGPSGSGKSTLMHCLAGLDTVSAGQVWLGDTEITGLKDKRADPAAPGPDRLHLPVVQPAPTLNARGEHHAADGHRRPQARPGVAGPGHRHARPARPAKHRPAQLSGGQQQRVAVARALAARPELIFADEPTGNLDSRAGAEVLGVPARSVDELDQTVVMVTHDPGAAAYADRVLFLADGRIVDDMHGPPRNPCWSA